MSEERLPFIFSNNHFPLPGDYLRHLAEALCKALSRCTNEERTDWMLEFRRSADELGIIWINRHGLNDFDEIRATLSPDIMDAMVWARACVKHELAHSADPDDPCSVIDRLCWPIEPGCRARDD